MSMPAAKMAFKAPNYKVPSSQNTSEEAKSSMSCTSQKSSSSSRVEDVENKDDNLVSAKKYNAAPMSHEKGLGESKDNVNVKTGSNCNKKPKVAKSFVTKVLTSDDIEKLYTAALPNVDKWLENQKENLRPAAEYGDNIEQMPEDLPKFDPMLPLLLEDLSVKDSDKKQNDEDFDLLENEDHNEIVEQTKKFVSDNIVDVNNDKELDDNSVELDKSHNDCDGKLQHPGRHSPVNAQFSSGEEDLFEQLPDEINAQICQMVNEASPNVSEDESASPVKLPLKHRRQKSTVTKAIAPRRLEKEYRKEQKGGYGDVGNLEKTKQLKEFQPVSRIGFDKIEKIKSSKFKKTLSKVSVKKRMLERNLADYGTWVQCGNLDCMKWRHLHDVHDPSIVQERWTCKMNSDLNYNKCDIPEQEWVEDDDGDNYIYSNFTEGSVVWAKMAGYPWWPAMIEIDPDTEWYFEADSVTPRIPSHYHVVFFDEKVSRAWVNANRIISFDDTPDVTRLTYYKTGVFKKDIHKAKEKAMQALDVTLQERLKTYGFAARYKGHWGKEEINERQSVYPSATTSKSDVSNILSEAEKFFSQTVERLDTMEEELLDSMVESGGSDFDPEDESTTSKKIKKRKHKDVTYRKEKIKGTHSVKSDDADEIKRTEKKHKKKSKKSLTAELSSISVDCGRKSSHKKKSKKTFQSELSSTDGELAEERRDKKKRVGNIITCKSEKKILKNNKENAITPVKPTFAVPKFPSSNKESETSEDKQNAKQKKLPFGELKKRPDEDFNHLNSDGCFPKTDVVAKKNKSLRKKLRFQAPVLSQSLVTPEEKESNKENLNPAVDKESEASDAKSVQSKAKRKLLVDVEDKENLIKVADASVEVNENPISKRKLKIPSDDSDNYLSEKSAKPDSYLVNNSIFTMEMDTHPSDLELNTEQTLTLSQKLLSQADSVPEKELNTGVVIDKSNTCSNNDESEYLSQDLFEQSEDPLFVENAVLLNVVAEQLTQNSQSLELINSQLEDKRNVTAESDSDPFEITEE